ncbi:MAG: hypothetical protein N3E39_00160 [Candidatus Methanomethylicia archaeon]|nr:hypothetical protein [Candidatus Methanomethylicia archaeon]
MVNLKIEFLKKMVLWKHGTLIKLSDKFEHVLKDFIIDEEHIK